MLISASVTSWGPAGHTILTGRLLFPLCSLGSSEERALTGHSSPRKAWSLPQSVWGRGRKAAKMLMPGKQMAGPAHCSVTSIPQPHQTLSNSCSKQMTHFFMSQSFGSPLKYNWMLRGCLISRESDLSFFSLEGRCCDMVPPDSTRHWDKAQANDSLSHLGWGWGCSLTEFSKLPLVWAPPQSAPDA